MITAYIRHEGEVQAATTSNKMELSRVTKDLDATKATLAQHKMSAETLNSQVCIVLILNVLSYLLLRILPIVGVPSYLLLRIVPIVGVPSYLLLLIVPIVGVLSYLLLRIVGSSVYCRIYSYTDPRCTVVFTVTYCTDPRCTVIFTLTYCTDRRCTVVFTLTYTTTHL